MKTVEQKTITYHLTEAYPLYVSFEAPRPSCTSVSKKIITFYQKWNYIHIQKKYLDAQKKHKKSEVVVVVVSVRVAVAVDAYFEPEMM